MIRKNKFDGFCIELTKTQIKRVEKVFILNNRPYFSGGDATWDKVDYSYIQPSKNADKFIINAGRLIGHIKNNKLGKAIKTEFAGVDLLDWMQKHKIKRSLIKK